MPKDPSQPKELDSSIPPYGVLDKKASVILESGAYAHGPSRSEWLREDLKKIEERKVDHTLFNARESSNTEKFRIIEDKVDSLKGCSRNEEFEDMKRAIDSWRNFFRNTVAIGAISGLAVIGGWLWQYYALTSTVSDTSNAVKELATEVKSVKIEIQTHKEVSLENALAQQKEIDSRFGQMEFKILSAVSSASHGKQLDQPSSDAYYQTRKKQLIQQYGAWSNVPMDDATKLRDEVKALTKVNP
jgi:hypothetical protein